MAREGEGMIQDNFHELVHHLSELDKKVREVRKELDRIGKIVDEMVKNGNE